MLVINARLDTELQCLHWYSRVPSRSNLSDDPSRLVFEELERHGFKRCTPCYIHSLCNMWTAVPLTADSQQPQPHSSRDDPDFSSTHRSKSGLPILKAPEALAACQMITLDNSDRP